MPKQMKGGSFSVRPGRQSRLSRQVVIRGETRFKPGNPQPVVDMMRGLKGLSESQEERIQQA